MGCNTRPVQESLDQYVGRRSYGGGMYLENLVIDALDPQRLGRFWEAVVGGERLTDEAGIYETRLSIPDGPALDLCFQQVPEPPTPDPRLHPDLLGGARQAEVVERLIGLGARPLDIGQHDVPWVVLADPEGNPLCVMDGRPEYVETGPLASLPLDSADPERDAIFWSWLTGWHRTGTTLRHPSARGPLLELCEELGPKRATAKNRLHLDVRLEVGEDADGIEAQIIERGGVAVPATRDFPWRTYQDPSGNEFCVLAASSQGG